MTLPPPFPDAEKVLVEWLDNLDGAYSCTALPEEQDFDSLIPMIVCNRIGGGSEDGITDRALVAVLVIHNSRAEAWTLASRVRDTLFQANVTPTAVNDVQIDGVEEVVGNNEVSDVDPDSRMVDSSFYVSFRRPWA